MSSSNWVQTIQRWKANARLFDFRACSYLSLSSLNLCSVLRYFLCWGNIAHLKPNRSNQSILSDQSYATRWICRFLSALWVKYFQARRHSLAGSVQCTDLILLVFSRWDMPPFGESIGNTFYLFRAPWANPNSFETVKLVWNLLHQRSWSHPEKTFLFYSPFLSLSFLIIDCPSMFGHFDACDRRERCKHCGQQWHAFGAQLSAYPTLTLRNTTELDQAVNRNIRRHLLGHRGTTLTLFILFK